MKRTIAVATLMGALFAIFMACTDERLWHPTPLAAQGHHAPSPYHRHAPCPCAELLQPVYVTARRFRHPHDPAPMQMECRVPEVEAFAPPSVTWTEPPMQEIAPPVVDEPRIPVEWPAPPSRRLAWLTPEPRGQWAPAQPVPEPSLLHMLLAGAGLALFAGHVRAFLRKRAA